MKQNDKTYPNKLKNIGVTLLEEYKGSKKHHNIKCNVCNHVWNTTPVFIVRTHKVHKTNGCPNCNNRKEQQRFAKSRQNNIQKIKDRGFEIVSDWDGSRRKGIFEPTFVTVKNTSCGHTFEVTAMNLLARNVECGICGPKKRAKKGITKWSKENSRIWQQTATEWQKYKAQVRKLTRRAYKEHKLIINPTNHPRGKAGVQNMYHLDHIVPVRYCFEHNIPPAVCSHYTNLQMLHWHDNVGSRDKLKENMQIPTIFDKYFYETP